MHAVLRLVVGRYIPNIQGSWVKLGRQGALDILSAGANDLGGTLINESITRAAGAAHGQAWSPTDMVAAIESIGRKAQQRTTDYSYIGKNKVADWSEQEIRKLVNSPATRRAVTKRS